MRVTTQAELDKFIEENREIGGMVEIDGSFKGIGWVRNCGKVKVWAFKGGKAWIPEESMVWTQKGMVCWMSKRGVIKINE